MDVTPLMPKGTTVLSGYGAGGFKLNNEFRPGSLFITPDKAEDWPVTEPSQITLESLAFHLTGIELLLIGTGKNIAFIAPEIRAALKTRGVALEVMDTGAASRTYNVLLSEGRRVAAALIAV